MRKRKDYWNELLPYEKIAEIAMGIFGGIGILVLIGDILQWTGVIRAPFDLQIAVDVLLTLMLSAYAVRNWRKERGRAIAFIVFAVLKAAHVIFTFIV